MPDQNPLYDALFRPPTRPAIKLNPDYNSEDQEGVVKTQAEHQGPAADERGALLHLQPAMERPNLHVVTEAHDPARAARGQALRRRRLRAQGPGRSRRGAGREVILSAGAVATPQILELSGIGKPEILQQHGIEVRTRCRRSARISATTSTPASSGR